ncbi:Gfo/Idh/MocA family protein [Crateriforma conspicua]|uniref:Gfo/Idh/MocA family protein n=1 Tax=Crateriforma conspicua TaxID=2527996 RepID=UPI00118BFD87|nr:Gfo/Idh/MocA family oxidoreductase [Crateriforma conspicua]QDV65751.1 Inositol 2-dehydrogenase [Crateriforma conspicua]
MTRLRPTRRDFLKASAATTAVTTPYFYSQPRTLADETASANSRIPIGVIGSGGMAGGNMKAAKDWLDVVAICDADSDRAAKFNESHSGGKAKVYTDYHDILADDSIPLIHVATPDHWHTKPLIEAMLAGKDVYCEKPLTLTIDEGKQIRKVQKETGRIVQVGTQQRSTFNLFVKAMAIVAEGRLGKIKRLECGIGGAPSSPSIPVADVPANLDWDRWLGPAPETDYRFLSTGKGRPNTNCHYEFRWWYQYSGGKLTDWGAHHVDIANWALKLNGQTAGPTGISGSADHPVEFADGVPQQDDRYNTATKFEFTVSYPDGAEMVIRSNSRNGVLIEGEKGRIFVSRRNLDGAPVDALKENPLADDTIAKVYKNLPMERNERQAHWANFLHCHREGLEPISDVHSHMQMLNICHLAGISARLGRDLKWDDSAEQIVGDDEANAMLARPYREGYEIQMG